MLILATDAYALCTGIFLFFTGVTRNRFPVTSNAEDAAQLVERWPFDVRLIDRCIKSYKEEERPPSSINLLHYGATP